MFKNALVLSLALLSPAALAGGSETYATMCATCHGAAGAGDGVAATGMDPAPAKFTDAAFWDSRSDEDVTKAIKEGGAAVGKSPLMAPYGAALDDAAIAELVAYLKTLKQ